MIFPDDANHFPPELHVSILSFIFQRETIYLYRSTVLENLWFCCMHHNPDSPKFLKSAMKLELSRHLISNSSKTTSVFPPIKTSIENFKLTETDLI